MWLTKLKNISFWIKKIIYLPDKDFMVPYFSAHFTFHTYDTKFCGIEKWYAGTEKWYAGTEK